MSATARHPEVLPAPLLAELVGTTGDYAYAYALSLWSIKNAHARTPSSELELHTQTAEKEAHAHSTQQGSSATATAVKEQTGDAQAQCTASKQHYSGTKKRKKVYTRLAQGARQSQVRPDRGFSRYSPNTTWPSVWTKRRSARQVLPGGAD